MIFGKIFKKDNKEENEKRDKNNDNVIAQQNDNNGSEHSTGDTSAGTEDELLNPTVASPVLDVKLGKIFEKGSKTKKVNTQIRKSSLKTSSNRESHITRSHHKKPRTSVKDIVSAYDLIKKPLITEKAADASERGVYIFAVSNNATKHAISDAIEAKYNVKPVRINMAKIPAKPKRIRIPGKERSTGYTSNRKKAYVYLKKGDTIKLT